MRFSLASVHQQAMVILSSSSEASAITSGGPGTGKTYTIHSVSSAFGLVDMMKSESRILRNTFSSVPVIWQWELSQEYQELGEALSEMTALEGTDEEKIDASVYDAASHVAAELMAYSVPAPRVFNHGPESVVFNWSHDTNNLYLTISANRISALISSPQRIMRRIQYSPNESLNPAYLLFPLVRSSYLKRPVMLISSAVFDPPPPALVS